MTTIEDLESRVGAVSLRALRESEDVFNRVEGILLSARRLLAYAREGRVAWTDRMAAEIAALIDLAEDAIITKQATK